VECIFICGLEVVIICDTYYHFLNCRVRVVAKDVIHQFITTMVLCKVKIRICFSHHKQKFQIFFKQQPCKDCNP
jgi:hypothetical protein